MCKRGPEVHVIVPVLLLAVLAGCARNTGPQSLAERAKDLDWELTPSLPSPDVGTYMASAGKPKDPLVTTLVGNMSFDRSLEAAAAGMALSAVEGFGGIQRWELREALWRGGWPYPVFDARGWSAASGEAPPDDMLRWLEAFPEGDTIGLVRARGRLGDAWVGMRAHPEIDLGLLPRAAVLGQQLVLPQVEGATYRIADGGGTLFEGNLDRGDTLLLTSAGEWVVQVLRAGKELARFPVYVEIAPPDVPLLRTARDAPLIGTAADADTWTRDLLKHVRTTYRLPPWEQMPMLDSAASTLAADPNRGADDVLKALGYDVGEALVWTCDDVTVENCLDRWIWDPRRREGLLSLTLDSVGLHTVLDARGLHLLLVLADVG
jgi:hypothetical protein